MLYFVYCNLICAIIAIANLPVEIPVLSIDHRGHGMSKETNKTCTSWEPFGNDINEVITKYVTEPVIGVGHSMGASTLILAALQNPSQFKHLILYEPIMFPSIFRFFMRRSGDVPLAVSAKRRRTVMTSKEDAIKNFKAKLPMKAFASGVV